MNKNDTIIFSPRIVFHPRLNLDKTHEGNYEQIKYF